MYICWFLEYKGKRKKMIKSGAKDNRLVWLTRNILIGIGLGGVILVFSFSKSNTHESNEVTNTNVVASNLMVSGVTLPEEIEFAGERIPLEYFDIKEALEREMLINSYWHSQTILLLKRAKRYFTDIEPILKANNIPDDFKFLALAESGLTNVQSPAGAVGFWQFIPATAKEYGLEVNTEIDERYNVEKSTNAACMFLKNSYSLFKSWTMAAASYNCGSRGLGKQVQKQYSSNYYDLLLNEETSRYLFRIVALKLILENPQKYGFNLNEADFYQPIPCKKVTITQPVKDWALFAFEQGTNYKLLKMLNPWLREGFLTNTTRKTYTLKIPVAGFRNHERELTKPTVDSIAKESEETPQ
jgi:membrane-bound lytic murein transglycosylase D